MLSDMQFIRGVTRLANPLYKETDASQPDQPEYIDQEIFINVANITMFYELPDEENSACVFMHSTPELPICVRGKNLEKLKRRLA